MSGPDAVEGLKRYFEGVIDRRDELVLPLTGGPVAEDVRAVAGRAPIAASIDAVLRRGMEEGIIRDDVNERDVIVMASMLAQGLPHVPDWPSGARRQVALFLAGLISIRSPHRPDDPPVPYATVARACPHVGDGWPQPGAGPGGRLSHVIRDRLSV